MANPDDDSVQTALGETVEEKLETEKPATPETPESIRRAEEVRIDEAVVAELSKRNPEVDADLKVIQAFLGRWSEQEEKFSKTPKDDIRLQFRMAIIYQRSGASYDEFRYSTLDNAIMQAEAEGWVEQAEELYRELQGAEFFIEDVPDPDHPKNRIVQNTQNTTEQDTEHIPTPEEILEVFADMIDSEYNETNRLTRKEDGAVYRLEATAAGTEEGEILELFYILKGKHENGDQSAETQVHGMYTKGGDWSGAGPEATLKNGKWEIIK